MSRIDPSKKSIYHSNGSYTLKRLDSLSIDISTLLNPIKHQRFVTFHDAFQYFENSYGLKTAGVITISPEIMPGADRIKKLRAQIKTANAQCVFTEPQFNPKLITTVITGIPTKTAIIDPLGAGLSSGPDQYFLMMQKLAKIFRICLSRTPVPSLR